MIPKQLIINSLSELSAITDVDFCLYDIGGAALAATGGGGSENTQSIRLFAASDDEYQQTDSGHLYKVKEDERPCYILSAEESSADSAVVVDNDGATDNADAAGGEGAVDNDRVYMMGRVALCQVQSILIAGKEKVDRASFFQNLLLDNLLLVDVLSHAKKLHIEISVPRVVILLEIANDAAAAATKLLRGMYSSQSGDYVTAVDEKSIILIKALAENEGYSHIDAIARTITDMMNTEALLRVRVSYGTIVKELKDVSKSYKEAMMAMDVGKIFYVEKNISAYNTLGIGRLIYQLPVNLCKIFINEIFENINPREIDEEIISTVAKFFENSLNVSETARQLFVHRNTLVYRIEKLEKNTGLDVRVFDDALTFKIAMMVAGYMRHLEG